MLQNPSSEAKQGATMIGWSAKTGTAIAAPSVSAETQ